MIPDLDRRERRMLREFAADLRNRHVRNIVARKALDRAADHLEIAAAEYADARPFQRGKPPI